jgi:hypothetical protein
MERFFRWALVASVVVGVQVALSAGSEAFVALNLDAPPIVRDDFFGPELGISAEAQREIWLAGVSGQRTALHNMQPWRVGTLLLLALASGLVAAQAFRMRFSPPAAQLAVTQGRLATAAAIFRTLDGAQNLVIARVAATTFVDALVAHQVPEAQHYRDVIIAAACTGSVMFSLAVVILFLVIRGYVRSETVKALLKE